MPVFPHQINKNSLTSFLFSRQPAATYPRHMRRKTARLTSARENLYRKAVSPKEHDRGGKPALHMGKIGRHGRLADFDVRRRQPVPARFIEVHLNRNACVVQCRIQHQRVLHGHAVVGRRCPKECGRRFPANVLFQRVCVMRHLVAAEIFNGAAVPVALIRRHDRIGQNGRIGTNQLAFRTERLFQRPIVPKITHAARKMPARRKSASPRGEDRASPCPPP